MDWQIRAQVREGGNLTVNCGIDGVFVEERGRGGDVGGGLNGLIEWNGVGEHLPCFRGQVFSMSARRLSGESGLIQGLAIQLSQSGIQSVSQSVRHAINQSINQLH